jgi:hypothetical protein
MQNITIRLLKDKEDEIQDGHQKIIEEVEFQLKNLKVKYDRIISKVSSIKNQAQRIEYVTISKKKTNGSMGV